MDQFFILLYQNQIVSNDSIFKFEIINFQMSHRLSLLKERISSNSSVPIIDPITYLGIHSLLSERQKDLLLKVRKFVDNQIKDKFLQHIDKATFPYEIIPKLKQLDIIKSFFNEPYGQKFPTHVLGLLLAEFSRGDASISTFVWLQSCLIGFTVQNFGSQKQKEEILPKLANFQIIGGWALTEKNIGSDASSIQSQVTKTKDGKYLLNGNKRWIGNGNGDILIVWAKNAQSKRIEGFLVPNKSKGLKSQPIKNKLSLRMVQNCQIDFENVEINMQEQKLQKGKGFRQVNKVLKHSRLLACWIALGLGMGIYQRVIAYGKDRYQFGRSILGFQLVQEKLVRIMSTLQSCLLLTYRISQMVDQSTASMGHVAMTKAYVTSQMRQIAKLGREILGGNGIIIQNYVIKALVDIQGIYTYQGSYDVNLLVAGRQITGISAIVNKQNEK